MDTLRIKKRYIENTVELKAFYNSNAIFTTYSTFDIVRRALEDSVQLNTIYLLKAYSKLEKVRKEIGVFKERKDEILLFVKLQSIEDIELKNDKALNSISLMPPLRQCINKNLLNTLESVEQSVLYSLKSYAKKYFESSIALDEFNKFNNDGLNDYIENEELLHSTVSNIEYNKFDSDRLDTLYSNEEEVDLSEVIGNLQKSFKQDIDNIDIDVIKSMDYWYYENIISVYLEKVLEQLDRGGC